MECNRCKAEVIAGEEKEWNGQTLCEDCYMDALSPVRTCDPWAVHSAKSFSQQEGGNVELSEIQKKILNILKETGGTEPHNIAEQLQIKPSDLEREIATLRHIEKLRGKLVDGKKIICLW